MSITRFSSATITGVVVDDVVYIVTELQFSTGSSFRLVVNDETYAFCCQCGASGCSGLQPFIDEVVEKAKALGVTKVICRKNPLKLIAGLPVEDAGNLIAKATGKSRPKQSAKVGTKDNPLLVNCAKIYRSR